MPSFNEQWNASSALLYELTSVRDQLRVLCRIYLPATVETLSVDEDAGVIANAALEALLVHVRVLIEFLVGRRNPKTGERRPSAKDVPATWFVDDWTYPPGPHPLDSWLDLIDAHLSHLSRQRSQSGDLLGEPIVWTPQMLGDLLVEIRRFDGALVGSDSPVAVGFRMEMLNLESVLAALADGPDLHWTTN